MPKTWNEVWEERRMDPAQDSMLARLMQADGLDTGFGSVGEEAWRDYVLETAAEIGISPESSVFEVGCGAGAYLFELYRQGCQVAGLDTSSTLIRYAKQVMPRGTWLRAAASALDTVSRYDFVIASASFLYFPTIEYANDVLTRMVLKARRGVMVLDVPDLAKRAEAIQFRRGVLGEDAYAAKYDGLEHLYFDQAWFESTLYGLGVRGVRMVDQRIDGYANSAYRYNVFGWRSGDPHSAKPA